MWSMPAITPASSVEKDAGDAEYTLRGKWIIPEGYKHYVELHDVKPSEEFETFLLALDVESMSLPDRPAVVKPARWTTTTTFDWCQVIGLPLTSVDTSEHPTLDFSRVDEVYTQLMLQKGLGAVTFKIPRAVMEKNLQRVLGWGGGHEWTEIFLIKIFIVTCHYSLFVARSKSRN